MFSIYTTLYNLAGGFIDWQDALENFSSFADEVCVSTTCLSEPDGVDAQLLREYAKQNENIKVVVTDFSLNTIDFDGKLKNAALSICTQPFCILLDGDERIDPKDKKQWSVWADTLKDSPYDAYFVSVIDLFNSPKEYKSIGQKWYLHKNLPSLRRGIVNFARKGDKIDTNRSDTCELIYEDGSLCKTASICGPYSSLDCIRSVGVKIWHLGWLDKEKRLKSNAFWQPVWNNRAGEEVTNIIHSKDKLDRIEYFPHKLKLWYE